MWPPVWETTSISRWRTSSARSGSCSLESRLTSSGPWIVSRSDTGSFRVRNVECGMRNVSVSVVLRTTLHVSSASRTPHSPFSCAHSVWSRHDVMRQLRQRRRNYPRLPQPVYRPRREPLRLGPRGAHAVQGHERGFRARRVFAGRLAELRGRAGGVKHVVVDLEGEPHIRAVAAQRLARGRGRPRREPADDAGGRDQGAGLAAVPGPAGGRPHPRPPPLRPRIQRPAPPPSPPPRGAGPPPPPR